MAKEAEKQTNAVLRTISILETLSYKNSVNLESLSRETELPKATLLRFLSTLINLGYVYKDASDCYCLTLKMFSVGSRSLSHIDLISTASSYLKELSDELKETCHMGILEGDAAVYVLKEESKYTLRMYSRVGKSIPLYCTAIGKIFLSRMSDSELDEYLSRNALVPFTAKSIRSKNALKEELERIRDRGYSVDDEEHEEGIMCIASPVFNQDGEVIAAISVSWPTFRFDKDNFENIMHKIKRCANEISSVMGYSL